MKITYDNYNTIEIHETFVNNYFATSVRPWHIQSSHIYALPFSIKFGTFTCFVVNYQIWSAIIQLIGTLGFPYINSPMLGNINLFLLV